MVSYRNHFPKFVSVPTNSPYHPTDRDRTFAVTTLLMKRYQHIKHPRPPPRVLPETLFNVFITVCHSTDYDRRRKAVPNIPLKRISEWGGEVRSEDCEL
ncbi:hypothetical protein CDAR_401261 [Caerostris darwini]|uniref:Uncharacterized protein n=1 Tax=Caerostris darwini TaxID=1538125 RepID=A0AAV4RVY1_9ARAC|nr:hypothetical protein CDAR_401261 [Caerostris darwini]